MIRFLPDHALAVLRVLGQTEPITSEKLGNIISVWSMKGPDFIHAVLALREAGFVSPLEGMPEKRTFGGNMFMDLASNRSRWTLARLIAAAESPETTDLIDVFRSLLFLKYQEPYGLLS